MSRDDLKSLIFMAARDGEFKRLKLLLHGKAKEEITELVSSVTQCSMPLVMSCRNGHLDTVQYLIEKCHANIEQVGSVSFDEEIIEGAPPLWCAAAAGHLDVVKYLVCHNADLNATTKTLSTPLRAACFDGHFEIVEFLVEHGANIEIANSCGNTSLMIACYRGHFDIAKYLIQCGADVNRSSNKKNVALHESAEHGSLEIFKLLLDNGAKMTVNSYGVSPLLSAANAGHSDIVNYAVEESYCSQEDEVSALELLGATCVDQKHDLIYAMECWQRAMSIRYQDANHPLVKPFNKLALEAVINVAEVQTLAELKALNFDPDAMRMQALLIRERILGLRHPDTSYHIRFRGASYVDRGNFDMCIRLWMYDLDLQETFCQPLSHVTQTIFRCFAELFARMMLMSQNTQYPEVRNVTFKDIVAVFHRVVKEIRSSMPQITDLKYNEKTLKDFHRVLSLAIYLVSLMCMLREKMSEREEFELKQAVHELLSLSPRGMNGFTPLHIACNTDCSLIRLHTITALPSLEVVQLLLEMGGCPNVVDCNRNTPLHITTLNQPCTKNIFMMLLKHGAHLDMRNKDGKTAFELYVNTTPDLYINPLHYTNLQCLSAIIIRKNGIQFCGIVPKSLEAFIEAH